MLKKIGLLLIISCSFSVFANDLDDGIGLDEPINDDLKIDTNVQFIKRKALAKSKGKSSNAGGMSCGIGSVCIQSGSDVKEINVVSDNKGSTNVSGQ